MKRASTLAGLLLLFCGLARHDSARAAAPGTTPGTTPVRAWEAPLTVPTYPVGPAEPNPMFYAGREYQGAQGPVYPYPLLDQLGGTKEDRAYRALWLENDFVRLAILPELGGRIFSAEDKTDGYRFFYLQHVVKPALIGMAGAWISGGLEWNVMHHHRATTFMPVQSALVPNADGSRTVWIGETEWRDRMRWVVGVTLRPGSSVVEADVRMVNRTATPHSVLYFANPAVHANADYEVLFPPDVAWATFHAKVDFAPWPLARGPFVGIPYEPGTNLAFWKNHPRPVSFFVYHSDLDFLGGYDHGQRAGVVHVADRQTVPGKKFWTWGNGPDGRMWDEILTDADGPYIELMTGGYSDNQPDYSWIDPGEDKSLVQRWFPIRELGGLKAASAEGALNLEVSGGRARAAVNATATLSGARVRLAAGAHLLLDEGVSLSPADPFVREVPLPAGVSEGDLRLSVASADGREVLAYAPRPRPKTPEPARYVPPPAPARVKSVEELVLAGRRIEQFRSADLDPEPYYREALRRDPGCSAALTALGAQAFARGLYAEAESHLAKAAARVTANHTRARDGEPQYRLGLALAALGRVDEARDAFGAAAWDAGWRGPALLEAARLEGREARPAEALGLADRAVAASPRSTAALALRAALLRRAGRADEAFAAATRALDVDALDPLAARERRLAREAGARVTASPADALEAAALGALDEDAYALEAAHDYMSAGLLEDAAAVLARRLPDSKAIADPLVAYTLGYVRERQGDTAAAKSLYRRGRDLPSDYCFPFRLESVPVLERARAVDPSDPRAPYYLGNLLYDRQPDAAIAAWEASRALDPGFARVHRNLAFAYARARGDLAAAAASQARAVAIAKDEPRLYYELDQYLAWRGAPLEERLARLTESPAAIAKRDITRARLARVQLLLGRADDAIDTLSSGRFHVWEGERGIHEVYVEARLERGRARLARGDAAGALAEFDAAVEIPGNIEVGQAVGEHLAAARFHRGLALAALGRKDDALVSYTRASGLTARLPENEYWIGRSLEKLGRAAEARARYERLAATRPGAGEPALPLERRMAERESIARAHARRALGLAGLGRLAEARAALARSRAADPGDVLALSVRDALGTPARAVPR
jgi:tetratricopeptide (TPR) repeat protein